MENRKFKIGDAVEAAWIGDMAMYPGTIEGYFTEGRYDVKWADPQGMAAEQPTPEENIEPLDPAKYYRYGLGAWEAGDVGTAYLCMRTIFICVGPFAKTEEYLTKLMAEPAVKELMAKRNDKNPFADRQSTKERMADATTTVQRVGDELPEGAAKPEKGQFYQDEEIEELRSQAKEENLYQNMWLQYNQAKKVQEGKWYSVWEDYAVSKRELVKQQDRKSEQEFKTGLDVEGLPEFCISTDGTKMTGAFYPMEEAHWFVDKAYTTGSLSGNGESKTLEMELGLRHEDLRVACTFVYNNGVGGNTYALDGVRVGRQKLGAYPDGSEVTLFGDLMGVLDTSAVLSGPADKEDSTASSTEDASNMVTLSMKGGIAVAAPAVINGEEINREVTMCWELPAVEGIAWDGADRMIPALHYRASRIFKGVTESIEMLSITESRPS